MVVQFKYQKKKCALTCHISVDRFSACVKMVAIGKKKLMNSSHPLTLRGFLNEFSCITSLDVRTVTLDPLASTAARSWCARIVRFTASGPKFTICKHNDITGIWSFQSSKIAAVVKWVKSTTHTGYREKDLLVSFTFTLRKLLSVSLQVIADAANESEYLDVILTGWNSAPLDSRKNVCIQ